MMVANHSSLLAIAALVLVACTPKAPDAMETSAGPQPDASIAANFPGCRWGEIQSSGVSIWSFSCEDNRFVADPALPGFVRESPTPEGMLRVPVIVLFSKAETDPLNAVLPAVRAASPGRATATCEFEEVKDMVSHYQFMPTGEARKTYDALISPSADTLEPKDPDYLPCGEWGPSEAGMRVFTVVQGAGDKVAGIHIPSDIPLFDVQTLRKTEPAR
jgi:hypothetical protein